MTYEESKTKVNEIVNAVAPLLSGSPHYLVDDIMDKAKEKLSGLCQLTYPTPSSGP